MSAPAAGTLVTFDWLVLAPVAVPALGAVLVLVVDVVAPRLVRLHAAVGLLALAAGIALAVPGALRAADDPLRTLCLPAPDGACLYEAGPLASALQLGALASALVVLLLSWPGADPRDHLRGGPAVIVSLVLAATAGAAGVAAAHDLGSWLVCLELATLPAIALVALRGDGPAGRGALALLTTSLVSFAMVALGAALWLLSTGEAVFAAGGVQDALADPERRVVLLLGAAAPARRAGLQAQPRAVPRLDPAGLRRRHRAGRRCSSPRPRRSPPSPPCSSWSSPSSAGERRCSSASASWRPCR